MKKSILLFPILLFSCASLMESGLIKKPEFNFERVEVTTITLSEVNLKLITTVKNPYPISLPKSELKLDLEIEGQKFTSLKSDLGAIKADSTEPLPFDLKVKYSDLLAIYKKLKGKEAFSMKLKGNLDIPIPASIRTVPGIPEKVTFPFEAVRDLPAILPAITIKNFRILKPSVEKIANENKNPEVLVKKATSFLNNLLDKKGGSVTSAVEAGLQELDLSVDAEFDIALKNESNATLQFENMNYDLFLGTEKFLSGNSQTIKNEGKESIITVKTSFPLKGVTQSIANAVKNRKTDFKLSGTSGIRIPALPGEGLLNFQYDKTGSFSW
ncbi:MAG: LEA type 2 family protein [Leptospira sp.]|nr:LEA type 2 family protein [Leptospira sp.]